MEELTGLAHAGRSELTGCGSGTTQKREAGARLDQPDVKFWEHAIVQERSCGPFDNDEDCRLVNFMGHCTKKNHAAHVRNAGHQGW